MNFWQISDGIQFHHPPHHSRGHGGDTEHVLAWRDHLSPLSTETNNDTGESGGASANTAAGGNPSEFATGSGKDNAWLDAGTTHSGGNETGSGGDGFFYGGIIHASLLVYEPVNITVAMGYGSIADASQTNNVTVDQSAVQIAGIGGNGGDGNVAGGGNVSSLGSNVITTGSNLAGNGGDGYFSGTLLDAPVVIYHPINIAVAGPGGTAHASQLNTVEVDQSALQIAGTGGHSGSGNAAIGGNVSLSGPGSDVSGWEAIDTGSSQAGNGAGGYFSGSLVHTSVAVYDPVNIAMAGYNSSAYAYQTNTVYLDQSSVQTAGIGGNGGSGSAALGGGAGILPHLGGGSDAIATGSNGAGNGGNGYFSGSLIDVSVAIYAPINIAVAGPHTTVEADQVNNVHFDQSAVQIAGIGGNGGHGNLALGGDLAMHLLADLHMVG